VRKTGFFIFLGLLALLIFLYPPWAKGSSAVYLPLAFISASLFLSSRQIGLISGLDYLWLVPERGHVPALLAWGALALVSCGIVTLLLSGALFALGFLDTEPVREKMLSLPIIALVSSVTLAPIAEEMFFRGFLFRKIGSPSYRRKAGAASLGKSHLSSVSFAGSSWFFGALISSLLFALLHFSYGSIAEVLASFSIGMLLCAFTYKTRSLIPAIIAHAGFNLVSVSLALFCGASGCPF